MNISIICQNVTKLTALKAALDPQNCLTAKLKKSTKFLRNPSLSLSFFDLFDLAVKLYLLSNQAATLPRRNKKFIISFKILTVYDKCASPLYLKPTQLLIVNS
jgi:hypothetical protein